MSVKHSSKGVASGRASRVHRCDGKHAPRLITGGVRLRNWDIRPVSFHLFTLSYL